ncbi:MAG: Na-translocating system protein MpsC family protein [Caldilineaceae bacterium]
MVKEMRRQLFETSRPLLEEMVTTLTGARLVSLHTDMSTKTGERIVVLVVDEDLDKKFPSSKRKR